ncbi:hypothetical protein PoB_006944000 [Plakobranchus ocellatus]|uniref:Uncharacterized protein n=1 Tax=Plakobranchus ocellatus TaxID=259542 RepID=A0AAV4DG19_9GAST|nr:hypothetical protein PoB_006944000 [Plakobranchus ocellatus]
MAEDEAVGNDFMTRSFLAFVSLALQRDLNKRLKISAQTIASPGRDVFVVNVLRGSDKLHCKPLLFASAHTDPDCSVRADLGLRQMLRSGQPPTCVGELSL